jgi:RNA polymerase sigma-70 factor, ECF subfamily
MSDLDERERRMDRSMGAAPDPTAGEGGADSDEDLLGRVAAADPAALESLYERYKGMGFALADRITADAILAEDVLQEAFLSVWRNASRFAPGKASGRTWIMAIVHHRAIDALRRKRPAGELPEGEILPPSLVVPDAWPEVAGRLDREEIERALASIPPEQREAIELAYFGGLTQTEIASHTGAALGTVKSRVRMGLQALRAALLAAATGPPLRPAGS